MKKKFKFWKKVKREKNLSIKRYMNLLKKKNVVLSPWIENIVNNKRNNIKISDNDYYLYRIYVRDLGFKKATTLKSIYKKITEYNFDLVPPDIAIRTRLIYLEQKKGEW